jgi:hypothetical protein
MNEVVATGMVEVFENAVGYIFFIFKKLFLTSAY